MRKLTMKYRLKVPDRLAGLTALLLLVSSIITPLGIPGTASEENSTVAAEDATSLIHASDTVANTAAKRKSFKISSLIFRF